MPILKIQSTVKEKGRYVTASLMKTFKLEIIDKVLKLPSLWPINTVTGKVCLRRESGWNMLNGQHTQTHNIFIVQYLSWFRQKVRLLPFSWEDYIELPLSVSESSGPKCQSRREEGTEMGGMNRFAGRRFSLCSLMRQRQWGERWKNTDGEETYIHVGWKKTGEQRKNEKKTGEVMRGKQYPLMKYKCSHTHFNRSNRADIWPREDYG